MKKTTFTKLLALAVAVIVIAASLTAGFGAFAETTANAGPLNLDFSDGFNHWTGETSIYSAENGVLKVNDTYESGGWRWLKTEPFSIPNAVAGTTVQLSFNVEFEDGLPSMNGNSNQQGTLNSEYGYKILDVFLADPAITDHTQRINTYGTTNQRNEVFYNEEGTIVLGPVTLANGTEVFDFWIGCGNSAKKTWQVTDITVTVTHPGGGVDTYPAPAGGGDDNTGSDNTGSDNTGSDNTGSDNTGSDNTGSDNTGSDNTGSDNTGSDNTGSDNTGSDNTGSDNTGSDNTGSDNTGNDNQGAATPNYYGTADKGFDSGTNANYRLKPVDGVKNLDFSEGFTYWSGRNGGGNDAFASDAFDLVTEGNNKYVKVKETGWVTSIRSAVFAVEGINAGDKISILYDVKGADGATFHIKLTQVVLKDGVVYDATTGVTADTGCATGEYIMVGSGIKASDFKWNLGGEGWTTRAGYWNNTLVQERPEGADQKLYFQIVITSDAGQAQAGDKLDAAIDNLRLVKIVDGVYYDALTGAEITESTTTGGSTGGSTTGGSTTGGTTGGTTGAGSSSGTSKPTGDSVLMLAALFFISGAAVFGTAKALKKSR